MHIKTVWTHLFVECAHKLLLPHDSDQQQWQDRGYLGKKKTASYPKDVFMQDSFMRRSSQKNTNPNSANIFPLAIFFN